MSRRVLRLLAILAVLAVGVTVDVTVAGAHDTHDEDIPTDTGRRYASRAAVSTPPRITFPVEGPVTYTDSFGACRGSGCSRSHEGNDLMGEKLQRLLAANDATVTWLRDTATPDGSKSNILILEDDAGWEYWYIHINNDWRDHFCFALTVEEVPSGVLQRWRSGRVPPGAATVPEVDLIAARRGLPLP